MSSGSFLNKCAVCGAAAAILTVAVPLYAVDWMPRLQWPGYDQGWGQWPGYQYQQPQPQQRRARPKPKPARKATPAPPAKDEENARSGKETPAPPQDYESANPLHQAPARAAAPAAVAPRPESTPTVRQSDGKFTAFVWDDADSLEKLAALSGVSQAELLKLNNLRRGELRDGQVLKLPASITDEQLTALQPERQRSREVWRGVRGQKRVALTFDAGGEDDAADNLVSYLTEARAPASFFVTGKFAAEHGKLLKQITDAGYPIHNHSWSHPEFTKIEDDKIAEELERTEWAIRDVTGKSTKPYWRPPFGDRDNRVLRAAGQLGYQSIYWTLDSLDSVGDKKSPEFIVSRIMDPPKSDGDADRYLDGAIILMHVGEPGTAAAVPLLIRALRNRGFTLVTVDEIIGGGSPSTVQP